MAIERTFVMLKPGVLQRGLACEIMDRIVKKGLKIIGLKMMRISQVQAEEHYGEHKGKPFFNDLVTYITSGPVIAMVIEADNGISVVRRLCGATKVEEAAPGTIRGDYAMHTGLNIIHSSDGLESAKHEIGLFFKTEEIIEYKDGNNEWI